MRECDNTLGRLNPVLKGHYWPQQQLLDILKRKMPPRRRLRDTLRLSNMH